MDKATKGEVSDQKTTPAGRATIAMANSLAAVSEEPEKNGKPKKSRSRKRGGASGGGEAK